MRIDLDQIANLIFEENEKKAVIKCVVILGNPGVTHPVPTAFIMNAVGREWIMPGLPMMQWVLNGSRLGYRGYSGYGMGHAWVTEDTVGMEWVTPGLQRMQ